MGLFGKDIRKIIKEVKGKTDDYSSDFQKEIQESFEDLREDYETNSEVVPEFEAFVNEIIPKLDSKDARQLEAFTAKLNKINRTARKGVEAMRELSRNQKKLAVETQWLYEEYDK